MSLRKLQFFLVFSTIICWSVVIAKKGHTCENDEDCGAKNEVCVMMRCQCKAGSLSFGGGDCVTMRQYGEVCFDPNQCLMSGDPHLECVQSANVPKCDCGQGTVYNFQKKKCEQVILKKMQPHEKPQIMIQEQEMKMLTAATAANFREYLLAKNLLDESRPDPKKPTFPESSYYFGPLVVALMSLMLVTICCCFWKIEPRNSDDLDQGRERAIEQIIAEIQLAQGKVNVGFHDDEKNVDIDTVSRHTIGTTIVDEKCDEKKIDGKKNLQGDKSLDLLRGMNFPHGHEVEYWLKQNISAGSDQEKQKKFDVDRKIDLVETDDATSIDTSVQDERPRQMFITADDESKSKVDSSQ